MAWSFFPAFLLLILVPVILYLNRRERHWKRITVSSHLFWSRILDERRSELSRDRIIRSLLLVLQLAAFITSVIALAGPVLLQYVISYQHDTVVVLDTSAGMKAGLATGTRFDAARREVFRLLDSVTEENGMLIIGAGAHPRIIEPLTKSREKLKAAIEQAAAIDEEGDMPGAILLAATLANRVRGDEIVIVTDGAWSGADLSGLKGYNLKVIRTAGDGRADNAGITRFSARRREKPASGCEVMFAVFNGYPAERQFSLALYADGSFVSRHGVTAGPGRERTAYAEADLPEAAALMLVLEGEDALAADNSAYWLLNGRTKRIAVAGPANPYLSAFLAVYPGVDFQAADPAAAPGGYDAVIYDRVNPAKKLPPGNYLFIDSLPLNPPFTVKGRLGDVEISRSNPAHPVLNGLNVSRTRIGSAMDIVLKPGAREVAGSAGKPLIVTSVTPGGKSVFFAFDLLRSDLALTPDFAVIMGNILGWFFEGMEGPGAMKAGQPRPFRPPDPAVTVTTPDNRVTEYQAAGGTFLYTGTERPGFYRISSGGRSEVFAVNLESREESDLKSRMGELPVQGPVDAARFSLSHIYRVPVQLFFILAVIAALAAEWAVFRRKVKGRDKE
jgi:hypothetical protein